MNYKPNKFENAGGLEPDPDYVEPCINPQHNPPMHLHIPAGLRYRHVCPTCGKEVVIRSQQVTL